MCTRILAALNCTLLLLLAGCSTEKHVQATVRSVRLCDDNGTWHMIPFARYDDGTVVALRDESSSSLSKLPWGMDHRVELTVTKHPTNVGGLGGTSTRVHRVLSSTSRSGEALILPVNSSCFAQDGRSFLDGQTFTCSTPEVCAALDRERLRRPSGPWEMEIHLAARPGAPFTVERVHPREESVCKFFPCTEAKEPSR